MSKILIVEDNELNRRLFSDLLKTRGHQVFECADGRFDLNYVRQIRPDLILMDIQMPDIDGLTATRMIRETPEIANTKVIAVTAFAMEGDRERILSGGCNGYLAKPIAIQSFFQTVDEILSK